jgi:hypothetical protein
LCAESGGCHNLGSCSNHLFEFSQLRQWGPDAALVGCTSADRLASGMCTDVARENIIALGNSGTGKHTGKSRLVVVPVVPIELGHGAEILIFPV